MVVNPTKLGEAMQRLAEQPEHRHVCPARTRGQRCCLEDPAVQEALWELLQRTPLR